MRLQFTHWLTFTVLLSYQLPMCFGKEARDPADPNRYLNAVREFADNVLKYGCAMYERQETAYDALWKEKS